MQLPGALFCKTSPRTVDKFAVPSALESCNTILLAGAGGGYDVYSALPLYSRLRSLGKTVHLANLSFARLASSDASELHPALFEVVAATGLADLYFPERTLCRFLESRGEVNPTVYAFANEGAAPVARAYRWLAEKLCLDGIVLVDGGTDILLRGDEPGLGTPAEDMVSLSAVRRLDLRCRMIACLGFGVDTYHGVNHASWLENVARLAADGSFLGALALTREMPESRFFLDATLEAERAAPQRESIVNASIASAIEGGFGNIHRSTRTHASELFISPLMSLLWMFDLEAVARNNLYLDRLAATKTHQEVLLAIERFRESVDSRPPMNIPY